MNETAEKTHSEDLADAVAWARNHPGVDHVWLSGFACINPTDEFAAEVGRQVIDRVMRANPYHEDVLGTRRHVVLSFNAS